MDEAVVGSHQLSAVTRQESASAGSTTAPLVREPEAEMMLYIMQQSPCLAVAHPETARRGGERACAVNIKQKGKAFAVKYPLLFYRLKPHVVPEKDIVIGLPLVPGHLSVCFLCPANLHLLHNASKPCGIEDGGPASKRQKQCSRKVVKQKVSDRDRGQMKEVCCDRQLGYVYLITAGCVTCCDRQQGSVYLITVGRVTCCCLAGTVTFCCIDGPSGLPGIPGCGIFSILSTRFTGEVHEAHSSMKLE